MSKAVSFSCEAESPAGFLIMKVLHPLEQALSVNSLVSYCEALDQIFITPCCVSQEFIKRFEETAPIKERRYISWQNRYADIRLFMDWETFVAASPEAQKQMCHQLIRDSLDVIAQRCSKKRIAFNKEALLQAILPEA